VYRLLTGEHPHRGSTPVAVLTQHLTEEPLPPSERRPDLAIDPAVDAIVMKAMAKDRNDRYASADELRLALDLAPSVSPAGTSPPEGRRITDARDASGTSPTGIARLRREDFDAYERDLRRRRWLGLVTVPVVLVCAVAGVVIYTQAHQPSALDVESEPNNSAAQANWIASDRTVRGHIGKRISAEESDRDFYQFNVADGTHLLRVELTGIPTMDLKLELFDSLGRRIAETDSGGVGEAELLPNVRLEPGDYYLAVREVWVGGRPATEDETNWYTLRASWHPLGSNEESEPDDAPSQAVPVTPDQPLRGYLGRAGDVDYFQPRGAGGGTLSGLVSGVDGVDTRVVVLPPGSASGPPGPLPPGARIFDAAGPGAPERFDGIVWPAGSAGPILVVERKEGERALPGQPRPPLVGLDVPYTLTVRLTHDK
jgi:hypothetical protein